MAFDYTTSANVFAYGNSAGTGTDPVNESTVMGQLVTGMSRALDVYCNQAFSLANYVDQRLRAVVDAEGVLTCYPAVPVVASISAAAYRLGSSSSWVELSTSQLDTEENTFGCVVRTLDQNFLAQRGGRLQMRLSYVGGYADFAALPSDFEWNVRRLCWWAYKKREAPIEKTAIPEMGVLLIPSSWPKDIREALRSYVRQVMM